MAKSENTKLSTITAGVIKSMIKDPKKIYTGPISIVRDIKNYGFGGIVDYAKKNPKKTVALITAGVVGGSALIIGTVVAAPLIATGAIFAPAGAAAFVGVAAAVAVGSVAFTVASTKLSKDIKVLSDQRNNNIDQGSLLFDNPQTNQNLTRSIENNQILPNKQVGLNNSRTNQNLDYNTKNITNSLPKNTITPLKNSSQNIDSPSNTPSNLSKSQTRKRSANSIT